jgi:hypothetical protein
MRALLAGLMLAAALAQGAAASEVRNFFAPELDGQRIGACLADGVCGKAAADAFCKAEGYDHATIFQRERSQSARVIDSGHLCEKDCTSFRQVKCYTVKSDLETGNTTL